MDILKLQKKIEKETHDTKYSKNLVRALCNAPESFQQVVDDWIEGKENEYIFNGITLSYIREKEKCSYLNALLRMQLLIADPTSIDMYIRWKPRFKDGRR